MVVSQDMDLPADLDTMREHAHEAAQLLKALANENRLLLLCTLAQGELSVGQLNEQVALSQSALSQHLALLRRDGLVKTRAYDGCHGIETLSGPDSVVALYERWESVEHHQAYVGWRMENGLVDLLEPWLAAPLEIAYYDETGV